MTDKGVALVKAVESNKIDEVRSLIRAGADVNFVDPLDGGTALHKAAKYGHGKIAELLTKVKPNPNFELEDHTGSTPLMLAAKNGHASTVVAFLIAGANPKVASKDGWTPLHHCSGVGNSKCCRFLLRHGAIVNYQNSDGETALHRAVFRGSVETVEALLESGADKSIKNKKGKDAYNVAVDRNNEVLETILRDVKVNSRSDTVKKPVIPVKEKIVAFNSKPDKKQVVPDPPHLRGVDLVNEDFESNFRQYLSSHVRINNAESTKLINSHVQMREVQEQNHQLLVEAIEKLHKQNTDHEQQGRFNVIIFVFMAVIVWLLFTKRGQ